MIRLGATETCLSLPHICIKIAVYYFFLCSSHLSNFSCVSNVLGFELFLHFRWIITTDGDSDEDDLSENLLLNDESCPESSKQNKSPQQQQSNVAISLFASRGVVDVLPHARVSVHLWNVVYLIVVRWILVV